jgi:hypothetical protein
MRKNLSKRGRHTPATFISKAPECGSTMPSKAARRAALSHSNLDAVKRHFTST